MAKIATDLDQSKKLAEILPIESADMYYHNTSIRGINYVDAHQLEARPYNTTIGTSWIEAYKKHNPMFEVVPAWSLSALLNILKYPELVQTYDEKWSIADWTGQHPKRLYGKDTPIDACVEMILKLKEEGLL